jgi:hypothetical protein
MLRAPKKHFIVNRLLSPLQISKYIYSSLSLPQYTAKKIKSVVVGGVLERQCPIWTFKNHKKEKKITLTPQYLRQY